MWYLGQESGDAVASILVGDHSPSGRLPTTFGQRLEDWPSYLNYPGEGGQVLYGEQVFMGYRGFEARGIEPAFAFGHGLGYSTFSWTDPVCSHTSIGLGDLRDHEVEGGDVVEVAVTVTNMGERAASEVVQCYVADPESSLRRPAKELKAFAKVHLDPGESQVVTMVLDRRAFAFWSPDASAWTVEPGRFDVLIGASSGDIRSSCRVDVTD